MNPAWEEYVVLAIKHKRSREEEEEDMCKGTAYDRETWNSVREMRAGDRGGEGVDTKLTEKNIIVL